MKVFCSPWEAGRWGEGPVVAIGKFDGVHLGHQALLAAARALAKNLKRRLLVVTFSPLPQEIFADDSFQPLMSLERRLALLAEQGAQAALVLPFSRKLACQAPEAFARDTVAGALKAAAVFVGENFCFGKGRAGTVHTLRRLGEELGFSTHAVPLVTVDGRPVSSSAIRALLAAGRRHEAERLLGRSCGPNEK